jgi:UDP-N-acetylmuramyl pentapeptide phosphotransferase/UDP-N-acetylglucosamine-1-phosphate transferase
MIMRWLLIYLYVFDVSFVLALLLTPMCRRLSFQRGYVDEPDLERKIHTQPMALLGGLAVFSAFAANVVLNYLVVLPLATWVGFPLIEAADVRVHIAGAYSVWPKLVVLLVGGALMVGSAVEAAGSGRDRVAGRAVRDARDVVHRECAGELLGHGVVDRDDHQCDEFFG